MMDLMSLQEELLSSSEKLIEILNSTYDVYRKIADDLDNFGENVIDNLSDADSALVDVKLDKLIHIPI